MSYSVSCPTKHGFTLLELTIVIIVLGLIVGGLTVGRDMIRAANVKAGISQISEYQTANNNFRSRYKGIPGDLRDATDQFSNTVWPSLGNGDGDGELKDADGTLDELNGEITQYWYHLSAAGLVDETFDGGHTLGDSFPRSKAGENGLSVLGTNNRNYFYIGVPSGAADATFTLSPSLTPEAAASYDKKMDDGEPLNGRVQAAGGSWLLDTPEEADPLGGGALGDACIFDDNDNDTDEYYAIGVDATNCQLRIEF